MPSLSEHASVVVEASLGAEPGVISQNFSSSDYRVLRTVTAGRFSGATEIDRLDIGTRAKPLASWYYSQLRGAKITASSRRRVPINVVDLFCGAGGFSKGIEWACEAVGLTAVFTTAVDLDPAALGTFVANHSGAHVLRKNVDGLVDFAIRFVRSNASYAYTPELINGSFARGAGRPRILIGGPPCQGHSNLNNHTRRSDSRNSLYLTVPSIGVAVGAEVIVVENVPAVLRDKNGVVSVAQELLRNCGYYVSSVTLEANQFGVAQTRKRHFLIGTLNRPIDVDGLRSSLMVPGLTVWDAISDLEESEAADLYNLPADISEDNRARIDFLFDQGLYDLPNHARPDCHKDGHTYPSVYGRLYSDKPAQTITGGFLSPGRGRFVHPTRKRGLTPHEGARLQGFPDGYWFERIDGVQMYRNDFAKLIGDAVPPPLGYVVGLACISAL